MTQIVVPMTIPPRTPKTAFINVERSVLSGSLVGGSILFPDGCKGLVGIRILDRGVQVYPDGNDWVTGNGNPPVYFRVTRKLEGSNYLLRVEGYNMASDWPHTPLVTLDVE